MLAARGLARSALPAHSLLSRPVSSLHLSMVLPLPHSDPEPTSRPLLPRTSGPLHKPRAPSLARLNGSSSERPSLPLPSSCAVASFLLAHQAPGSPAWHRHHRRVAGLPSPTALTHPVVTVPSATTHSIRLILNSHDSRTGQGVSLFSTLQTRKLRLRKDEWPAIACRRGSWLSGICVSKPSGGTQ